MGEAPKRSGIEAGRSDLAVADLRDLPAAVGRGASEPKAVPQHAEDNRGTAASGWLANRERGKSIAGGDPGEQVSAVGQVGGGKRTSQVTGTVKASRDAAPKRA